MQQLNGLKQNEAALMKVRDQFGLTKDQATSYLTILSEIGNTVDDDHERLVVMRKMTEFTRELMKTYEGTDKQTLAFKNRKKEADALFETLDKIRKNEELVTKNVLKNEVARKKGGIFNILETQTPTKGMIRTKKTKPTKTPLDKELQELEAYVKRIKPVITLTQDYEFAVSMLDRALEREVLTQQEHAEKLTIITDKYQIATGAALDFNKIATSASRDLGNSLMSLAEGTTTVKDAFRSMATNIIKELYRVMVVQQAVRGIMGAFGYSQASTGGYMKTPLPEGAEGGGYTGSGSRSGGVDGRGGFHAILHPQETVIDHTKGQGLGTTINQTINVSTGVQQTVRTEIIQLMPKIAETTKMAVLDAKRRGGSFSAAFN
jgi:hypothetical protein